MKNKTPQKLIFIYNADSGLRNAILDTAHKIVNPSTYNCSLCDITYGAFTENTIWKKFRKESGLEMEFLHRDEFVKTYKSKFGHKFSYPIVLITTNSGIEVLVKTKELNALESPVELIELIKSRSD